MEKLLIFLEYINFNNNLIIKMLKLEKPVNFNNIDKTNKKKKYLSIIRDLTSQGKYFSLINFIDNTTPNVSKYLY